MENKIESIENKLVEQFNQMFKDESSVRFNFIGNNYEVSRSNSIYLLTATSDMEGEISTLKYSKENAEYLTEWVMLMMKANYEELI